MTDDFDISPPNADADDGDERLRALLAVAPLDEVTRRRLVTTAMASCPISSARFRRLPAR